MYLKRMEPFKVSDRSWPNRGQFHTNAGMKLENREKQIARIDRNNNTGIGNKILKSTHLPTAD